MSTPEDKISFIEDHPRWKMAARAEDPQVADGIYRVVEDMAGWVYNGRRKLLEKIKARYGPS